MASTYTDGLAVEIIGSGDKAGSWGDVTNNNLKALEQGVRGFSTIAVTGTSTNINLPDGETASETSGDARIRSSVVRFTGASGNHTVTLQVGGTSTGVKTSFIAINALDSTHSLIIDVGGTDATIPNGYAAHIHVNGTTVTNSFANLSVDKLALGNQEVISNTEDDRVDIVSSTLQIGDGSGAAVIQSDGTGIGDRDLILRNSTTNTGSIRIHDADNGNIEITPDGNVETGGSVVISKVDINAGAIDGTSIGANAASTGAFTSATVDDIVLDGKVITMTGSPSDTATLTAGTNGTLDIVTTDATGTAANISITADGSVTLDAESNVTLDANGGTITFADDGESLGTITSSGYSGTAATVTTNANLTGPVTSSGNETTIASGVVTGSNFNITSGSVSGDYLLAADGTGGGLKWIEQPAGDITGVTAGTNLNGGGSEGAVTVNLDSAISLANVTTSSKIIVGADSDFTTGTAYIASEGGVRSSTYTSRTADQAMSISPNGTGSLNLSSTGTAGPNSKINIQCSTAPILIEASSSTTANSIIIFRSGGSATADAKLVIQDTGPRMPEPSSGNHYFNVSSEGGTTGTGLRNSTDGTLEIRSKNSSTADGWGRAYHSGMVSGDGAYVEVTSSYTGASGAAISFDISSLGVSSGDVPRILELWAKRVSGGDDIGYSEGDWIKLESRFRNGTNDVGYGIWATNSTVNIKAYNEPSWLFAPNKSDGADSALSTSGGWTIYVRAWK